MTETTEKRPKPSDVGWDFTIMITITRQAGTYTMPTPGEAALAGNLSQGKPLVTREGGDHALRLAVSLWKPFAEAKKRGLAFLMVDRNRKPGNWHDACVVQGKPEGGGIQVAVDMADTGSPEIYDLDDLIDEGAILDPAEDDGEDAILDW